MVDGFTVVVAVAHGSAPYVPVGPPAARTQAGAAGGARFLVVTLGRPTWNGVCGLGPRIRRWTRLHRIVLAARRLPAPALG